MFSNDRASLRSDQFAIRRAESKSGRRAVLARRAFNAAKVVGLRGGVGGFSMYDMSMDMSSSSPDARALEPLENAYTEALGAYNALKNIVAFDPFLHTKPASRKDRQASLSKALDTLVTLDGQIRSVEDKGYTNVTIGGQSYPLSEVKQWRQDVFNHVLQIETTKMSPNRAASPSQSPQSRRRSRSSPRWTASPPARKRSRKASPSPRVLPHPDCPALKNGEVKKCNTEDKQKARNEYKKQAMKFHPDRLRKTYGDEAQNRACTALQEAKFKELGEKCPLKYRE